MQAVADSLGVPPVVGAVLVCVLTIVVMVIITRVLLPSLAAGGKSLGLIRGDTLLLLGESNSGKTSLFYQLRDGKVPETVNSMKELDSKISLELGSETKNVKIVDFPGHRRLRPRLTTFYGRAAAIIFVIDSLTVSTELTHIAEFLFDLLTNREIAACSPPMLIACNKSDLPAIKSPEKIRVILEKELNALKKTRSVQLESVGDDADEMVPLGLPDQPFKFEDASAKVSFVSCSVAKGETAPVLDFVQQIF